MGGKSSARPNRPTHPTRPAYDHENHDYIFKVLVIGDFETGKTAIIQRYQHDVFIDEYKPTSGIDFTQKPVKTNRDGFGRLQFWDFGAKVNSTSMPPVAYREAMGCIIVFDASRASTFDIVTKLKADLDDKVKLPNGQPIPCILLANKCDLVKDGLVNNPEKMDYYCQDKGFDKWFETSARDGTNIEKAMQYLIDKIPKLDPVPFRASPVAIRK